MYKDILLAVDLEDDSSWRKALPAAIEYAKTFGSRLHVVTVVPDFHLVEQFFPADYDEKLKQSVNTMLHEFTAKHVPKEIAVQHIVAHGTIYEEIDKTARQVSADLIVMASHRPGLEDYLLGPNSEKVVRHSDCSVLIVR